jgi:hypothetical protein
MDGNRIKICCWYPGASQGEMQRQAETTFADFKRNMPELNNFDSYLVLTRTMKVAGMKHVQGQIEDRVAAALLKVIFSPGPCQLPENGENKQFEKGRPIIDTQVRKGSWRLFPKVTATPRIVTKERDEQTGMLTRVVKRVVQFAPLDGVSFFYATDFAIPELSLPIWRARDIPDAMSPAFVWLETNKCRVLADGVVYDVERLVRRAPMLAQAIDSRLLTLLGSALHKQSGHKPLPAEEAGIAAFVVNGTHYETAEAFHAAHEGLAETLQYAISSLLSYLAGGSYVGMIPNDWDRF